MWTLLLLTLPTQPAAVRLRVWRNLKALGSEPLRDGAYLLPSAHDGAFTKIAEEVIEHGGTAFIAEMKPRLKAQDDELNALFDRTAQYTQWFESLQTLRADIKAMTEVEVDVSIEVEAVASWRGTGFQAQIIATIGDAIRLPRAEAILRPIEIVNAVLALSGVDGCRIVSPTQSIAIAAHEALVPGAITITWI